MRKPESLTPDAALESAVLRGSAASVSAAPPVCSVTRRPRCVEEEPAWPPELDFWHQVVTTDMRLDSELGKKMVSFSSSEQQLLIRAAFHGELGTVKRHIGSWKKWAAFCLESGFSCAAPLDVNLLSFLMKKGTNAKSVRSSLRYAANRAECPVLLAAIDQPVVSGFARLSQPTSEVKNATPLQLGFLCFLEGIVLKPLEPLGTRLLAGAILAASWASLRFSDLQRSAPSSLSCIGWVVRGRCWKAKLRTRGFPFAFLGRGLTREWPQRGWAHGWFQALQEWLGRLDADGRASVSYLLPGTSADGSRVLAEKESRDGFVQRMRALLARFDPDCDTALWTAHSCKGTVLAWATMRDLPEHWIAQQGHHARLAARSTSVTTYGKCDVHFALLLQSALISAVATGWRPLPSQGRGARPPVPEPAPAGIASAPHDKEFDYGFRPAPSWEPPLPEMWQPCVTSIKLSWISAKLGLQRKKKRAVRVIEPVVYKSHLPPPEPVGPPPSRRPGGLR